MLYNYKAAKCKAGNDKSCYCVAKKKPKRGVNLVLSFMLEFTCCAVIFILLPNHVT